MREALWSPERFSQLCTAAVDDVAATFRSHDRTDPRLDSDGDLAFVLYRQFRGYRNFDPATKPQKAITGTVLRRAHELATTQEDIAIVTLLIAAFFFACRSCEYCTGPGPRKTKIIVIGTVRFFARRRELPHSDPHLTAADSVTIAFESQKNGENNEPITQHRTGDLVLCPVRQWARIVQCIHSYPNATASTKVNTVRTTLPTQQHRHLVSPPRRRRHHREI